MICRPFASNRTKRRHNGESNVLQKWSEFVGAMVNILKVENKAEWRQQFRCIEFVNVANQVIEGRATKNLI